MLSRVCFYAVYILYVFMLMYFTECFIRLVSIGTKTLHPLVLFVAHRHHSIDYCLELENLPFEKWISLMSIFYQKNHEIMFEPVFVENAKERIIAHLDIFDILLSSPPWFFENINFFIGLHLIEFGKFRLIFR